MKIERIKGTEQTVSTFTGLIWPNTLTLKIDVKSVSTSPSFAFKLNKKSAFLQFQISDNTGSTLFFSRF